MMKDLEHGLNWKNVHEARQTNQEAEYWKVQACKAVKHMLELTALLRKIMLLGILRGNPRLRDETLHILDGTDEQSFTECSETKNILISIKTLQSIDCIWTELDDPDITLWHTSCGRDFYFTTGTPGDNDMKYCCYCGNKLLER